MKIVRAENVSYEYTKVVEIQGENVERKLMALDNINIDIEEGSFIAVLGHNGSGKSTFAKHINALITPSSGTVWVDGYDTKDDEQVWNIRQSAGMVFQNPDNQLVATIVEEDIAFGPEKGLILLSIWSAWTVTRKMNRQSFPADRSRELQ